MASETSPPKQTLLLTGSTSFIGFAILLQALKLGHNIICPLRTISKQTLITSHPLIQPYLSSQRLHFIEVLDFTSTQFWTPILKEYGVEYIIHLATPKPRDYTGDDGLYVRTAVNMNLGILEAAKETQTVKRVVITSSIVAIRAASGPASRVARGEGRLQMPEGPPYENQNTRYTASKIAALKAVDDFVEREGKEMGFVVVNIMPGFVVGRQELAVKGEDMLRSSNRALLIPVTGGVLPYTGTEKYVSPTVHLDDVVDLHLECLSSEKLEGRKEWNFAVVGEMGEGGYESIPGIAGRLFPDAVESGELTFAKREGGEKEDEGRVLVYDVDVQGAEMMLGRKLKGLEEQVRDVVGCYLELVEKEKQNGT